MNRSLRDFLTLSVLAICILLTVLAGLSHIYRYSTINTYELILLFAIVMIIIITLALIVSALTVYHAYRRKRVDTGFLWLYRLGLRILLPFITLLARVIRYEKDDIRKFYIDVNNILVQSSNIKCEPGEVLVLLPHCLQNSGCRYKITNDIGNCRKCGRCCMGEIRDMAEKAGVKVAVATGGTLARNIVFSSKPGLILSVACERDLSSGIADVGSLPVIGMINERPNGPCVNTTVNVNILKEKLESFLKGDN